MIEQRQLFKKWGEGDFFSNEEGLVDLSDLLTREDVIMAAMQIRVGQTRGDTQKKAPPQKERLEERVSGSKQRARVNSKH
jgi:hypothetical protein